MNASQTGSDHYALSTHIAADHSAYHLSVDAGPYHVAYADVRPTCSSELQCGTGKSARVMSASTRASGIPNRSRYRTHF